jgi:large subunit ribosomal protein L1
MPSQKTGTVVANIAAAMKELTGKSDYRERMGVIRIPIGQLAFTEQELSKNIKAFMEQLKKEFGAMSFRADKSVNEVVLSSTHSAGFSLSGDFKTVADKEIPAPATAQIDVSAIATPAQAQPQAQL